MCVSMCVSCTPTLLRFEWLTFRVRAFVHSEGNFPPRLLCVYKSDSLRLGDEYMDTGIFRIHKMALPSVCVCGSGDSRGSGQYILGL